jgi:EAL domain-containing protein (putative c-di-GMP-specific phosphodiesterase class I)
MHPEQPQGETLKRDRDRFVGFAFAAADTLVELDAERRVRYVVGSSLVGDRTDIVGHGFTDLIATADRRPVADALAQAARSGRIPPMTVRLNGARGNVDARVLSGWCLPDLEGHFFLALRPGGEPANPASPVVEDTETGLLSLDGFRTAVAGAVTGSGRAGTMTFVDLEGLDAVRDRLHAEESSALMERIGGLLRASSLDGALAGRTGDQTFGLVHDASVDVRALVKSMGDLVATADPLHQGVRVREGSVTLEGSQISGEEVAEAVLYAMRKFGESRQGSVVLGSLTECYAILVSDNVERLAQFKRTVSDDEFRTVVQPIVEIRTGKTKHFELLSRFGDADEGSPQAMIAFAEEVGVICDFDLRVIARAITALQDADRAGLADFALAVNLSMRSVERPDFVAAIDSLLAGRHDLRARLIFEITETARIDDLRGANRAVQVLRHAGHRVCLDDFGAGAASFQYLKAFEIDAIKIDGAYITRALASQRSRAFLKAMARFCIEMDVEVVGEQVEDESTAQFLDTCGIRFGQGYYFGRPQALKTLIPGVPVEPSTQNLVRRSRRVFATR